MLRALSSVASVGWGFWACVGCCPFGNFEGMTTSLICAFCGSSGGDAVGMLFFLWAGKAGKGLFVDMSGTGGMEGGSVIDVHW